MKKSFLLTSIILIISTFLVSCWCPVGNPLDYEEIVDNNIQNASPYELSSGKAYYGIAKIGKNTTGSRNGYKFSAKTNVHCQFAEELSYEAISEIIVRTLNEDGSIKNQISITSKNEFDVPANSIVYIDFFTEYYSTKNTNHGPTYAEFYLYVD